MQHAINILLAVFDRLFRSELSGLFVFLLELLQPQSHATNADLVKTFRGKLFL